MRFIKLVNEEDETIVTINRTQVVEVGPTIKAVDYEKDINNIIDVCYVTFRDKQPSGAHNGVRAVTLEKSLLVKHNDDEVMAMLHDNSTHKIAPKMIVTTPYGYVSPKRFKSND